MSTEQIPDEEKPTECDFCHYENIEVKAYTQNRNFPRSTRTAWLCLICASTMAGNAHEYPEQYPDRESMRMLSWIGNYLHGEIIKGIRQMKRKTILDRLRELLTNPQVHVTATHEHECPYWRMGKKHGPCICGAKELDDKFRELMEEWK